MPLIGDGLSHIQTWYIGRMLNWVREFLDYIAAEGRVILGAPVAFFAFVLLAALALWGALSWKFDSQITSREGNELKGKFAMDTPISGVRRSRSDDLAARDICLRNSGGQRDRWRTSWKIPAGTIQRCAGSRKSRSVLRCKRRNRCRGPRAHAIP